MQLTTYANRGTLSPISSIVHAEDGWDLTLLLV